MAGNVESLKKGRETFLAQFSNAEELSTHMRGIAARRRWLIELGVAFESLLLRAGFSPPPDGKLRK